MIDRRRFVAALGAIGGFAGVVPCPVRSADVAATAPFPTRPVSIIVPFTPGGGTDVGARVVANKLSQKWGQSVVVENRPGAGGIVGAELVARARPDGYTLLMGNVGTQTINPPLYGKLPYDPDKAFVPISLVADLPIALLVTPGLKVANARELADLGKARPDEYTYASSGSGNSTHLAAEIFQAATGARFRHVPYKGGAQAMADVIAGHVPFQFNSVFGVTSYISSGKVRALAVASNERVAALPDVPTLAESGVTGAEMASWLGLLAPAGTPQAIVDRIAADVREVVQSADLRDTMSAQGAVARSSTPAEFAALIAADTRRYTELIHRIGIKPE